MTSFPDEVKTIYRRANDLSGGSLGILRETFQRFNEARASEAAAGMAYYALFSLFPLLLALVAAGSFFLESERAYREVVDLVTQAIPVSRGLIERNIRRVLELRGTVGIVGLIGLLWSATGVFTILANHINRAWPEAEMRSFLEKRLVALGMVGALAGLLVLSLFSTAVLNLLPRLQVPLWGGLSVYETPLWAIISKLVGARTVHFPDVFELVSLGAEHGSEMVRGRLGGTGGRLCLGSRRKRLCLVSQQRAGSI
jgi:membrane protein